MAAAAATLLAVVVGRTAHADDLKCADAVYKTSRNVGNQEQKNDNGCVKNGSGDIDACVDSEGAKSATQRTKLVALFAAGGKCETPPASGVNTDPNAIATGTEKGIDDVMRGTWGDPVDGIVAGDKCQAAVIKRAGKKYDSEMKAFRGCMKGAGNLNPGTIAGCIATALADAKAAGAETKLVSDLGKKCMAGVPAGIEDGECSTCTDAATCGACVGNLVDCNACLAMNTQTGASVNCDLADDGSVNGSCAVTCPLAPAQYTVTQASGGVLKVYSFAPFPFPSGGTIVQDVGPGDANCVHNVVVPSPGGFSAPNFCVPALGFTTSVTQTGCGVGRIDSNGGSDFDTLEVADTSNTNGTCSAQGPHPACTTGADNKLRVDITVGNGTADTCSSGTANAIVVVPVHTKSWSDNSGGTFNGCPGDGVFNGGDTTQADFDQILDFTTASAAGHWADLEGDGCSLAGLGPAGGHTGNGLCTGAGTPAACCTGVGSGTCPAAPTGICIDTGAGTVTTAAQGQFGSTTPGVGDGSFATYLPNTIGVTGTFAGATCGSPPNTNFGGSATRCLP